MFDAVEMRRRLLHRPGSSGGSSSSWDVSTSGEYWVVSQSQPVSSPLAQDTQDDSHQRYQEQGEGGWWRWWSSGENQLCKSCDPRSLRSGEKLNYKGLTTLLSKSLLVSLKLTKTLKLQRFAVNKFSGEHQPTIRKYEYFPNLVYDCSIVEVKAIK